MAHLCQATIMWSCFLVISAEFGLGGLAAGLVSSLYLMASRAVFMMPSPEQQSNGLAGEEQVAKPQSCKVLILVATLQELPNENY